MAVRIQRGVGLKENCTTNINAGRPRMRKDVLFIRRMLKEVWVRNAFSCLMRIWGDLNIFPITERKKKSEKYWRANKLRKICLSSI